MTNPNPHCTLKYLASSLLALSVLACGEDAAKSRMGAGDDTIIVNDGSCELENLTATCTCADQNNISGRQTCIGKMWTACECVASDMGSAGTTATNVDAGPGTGGGQGVLNDPPGNSSANRFAWKQTPFELGSCKAGHYVGTFEGFYGSPVIFGAPFPVVATDSADGSPGLEFTLEKMPGSGEIFAIKGGKMRGTASGIAAFTADLTGTLDCATKKYVGTIENGEYEVGVGGPRYKFVGTMTADYDKIQHKFIAGKWKCTEPPSTTIPPGGDGSWTTTFTP
jgi:hypothetical protein